MLKLAFTVPCVKYSSLFVLSTASVFTLKKPEEQQEMEKDDDFQTDEDEMEVSEMEEKKQAPQKRKKVSDRLG